MDVSDKRLSGRRCRRVLMVGRRACGGLTIAAMVVAVTVVATANTAHACSCVERELAEYADDISVAFSGSQLDRTVHSEVGDNGVALVFDVDRVYKGEAGPLIEVRTHAQGSACGIDMDGRGTVGVVAHEWKGDLSVHLCGSVVPVGELQDVFGEGYPPDESISLTPGPSDDFLNTSLVLPIAGAAVIVLVGAAVYRRRFRHGSRRQHGSHPRSAGGGGSQHSGHT